MCALGADSYHNSHTALLLDAVHLIWYAALTITHIQTAIGPERGLKRPKLVGSLPKLPSCPAALPRHLTAQLAPLRGARFATLNPKPHDEEGQEIAHKHYFGPA